MAKEDLTDDERTRLQNELTKADLEDSLGAMIGHVPGAEENGFTPGMEAEFLARVKEMESGGPASYVPIRTLLSRKVLKQAAAKAKQEKYEDAIELLLKNILTAGVFTEPPEWLTPRGYYYFLVQDFIEHTVPAPDVIGENVVQGQQAHMIGVMYEHVRQDSPMDLVRVSEAFLLELFDAEAPFTGAMLAQECRNGDEIATKAEAIETIQAWKNQWSNITPIGFQPGGPMRGPDGAMYLQFSCAYETTNSTNETSKTETDGVMQVTVEDKAFKVVGCTMQGFEM